MSDIQPGAPSPLGGWRVTIDIGGTTAGADAPTWQSARSMAAGVVAEAFKAGRLSEVDTRYILEHLRDSPEPTVLNGAGSWCIAKWTPPWRFIIHMPIGQPIP